MPRVSVRAPLEVIMVPLSRKRKINPASFAPMPRLYLELLENKEKIKKECTSDEFIPKYDDITFDDDGDEKVVPSSSLKPSFKPSQKASTLEKFSVKKRNEGLASKESSRKDSVRTSSDKESSDKESSDKESSDKESSDKESSRKELTRSSSKESSSKESSSKENRSSSNNSKNSGSNNDDENFDDLDLSLDDDITGNKEVDPLSAFLRKSRSIGSRDNEISDEKKRSYERQKEAMLQNESKVVPPSLQDLEDGGAFETGGIKNMSRVSKREQDSEAKLRELLFKFKLLKQGNPTEDIPNFTINSDPEFVAKTYDEVLRNLSLTDNVNKYKKYLMFGFMGVEALAGNILGFDMKGFTKQQIVEMSSYEKLIIELGEKNYVPQSKWPVELRLLGMIIMNAAFFIAGKMALRATGTDVLSSMSNAASAGVTASNIQQRKKQRMSGPSINLDDIPGLEPKAPQNDAKDISFV